MIQTFGNVKITSHKTNGPGRGRKQCQECGQYTSGPRSRICAHCQSPFPVSTPQVVDITHQLAIIQSYGGIDEAEKKVQLLSNQAKAIENATKQVKRALKI